MSTCKIHWQREIWKYTACVYICCDLSLLFCQIKHWYSLVIAICRGRKQYLHKKTTIEQKRRCGGSFKDVVAHWRCGGSFGDMVAHLKMWWLISRCDGSLELGLLIWRCGGSLELWWLIRDVVAPWRCDGSLKKWWLIGDKVALW